MKPIFRTDIALIVLFVASLFTGIKIHLADHFDTHDAWHDWSVAHVVVNVLFLRTAVVHIKQHWGWFKTFFSAKTLKSKITKVVAVSFLAVVVSGLALLVFAEGQGSHAGLVHYWIGMIFSVFALGHFLKRFRIFKAGISKR